ncbi:type 1 glutamine amidotransferase domain-containing protein [Planococcus sp. ISL-109]|uniref:type 1 glutamine amidotransferase domain-containing protein n=1 Tax=Planococcus sp. ISL-109 TaxID=2819166 RepID=UPI001BEAF36A|nr:type 1 glutamine amidotransferase domain-containing protein [Planococcus sp. ISL-109]MBT2581393.1 type 1 glutamine amidotransferase domain-containing protein [Planococcus sp. ISL-109]
MKKILIVVTNHKDLGSRGKKTGLWLRELTDFYHEVKDDFQVDIISTSSNKVPIDPRSLPAAVINGRTRHYYLDEAIQRQLDNPLTPEQINADDYAGIYFTGGHGTMWDFPDNEELQQITARIYEQGGIIAAVCHGPSGLLNVHLSDGSPLLAGHLATGFSDFEEKLLGLYKDIPFSLQHEMKERGALVQIARLPLEECVIESGRLITGQNPASASTVGQKMREQLKYAERYSK